MEEKQAIPSAFTRGLILGIIISLGIAIAIIVLVTHTYSTNIFFDKFIPPLIVSAATLIAALSAINSVKQNIENQNRLHRDSQKRKLSAARAALPLALREIDRICISVIEQLSDYSEINDEKPVLISNASQETIKLVIEHADEKMRKQLSNLLMYYQMAISSFNNYKIASSENPNLDHLYNEETIQSVIYWASLRAVNAAHLDYARGISQEFSVHKANQIFIQDFFAYKDLGRYKEINIAEFNEIFNEAVDGYYPGFLNPNFFGR